ncbi:MAG: GatB/YqeY domain-containing protein [Gammaproteobacteria bacterium]|nr:GatB/YqeY domain-containing protein [Gammaproteobacteria bacterium]
MASNATIKENLVADMKSAMRAGKKPRLATIRLALAAIKQIEVDERKELDETEVLQVLDKMCKQRRESMSQFEDAGRTDLVEKEQAELAIIAEYLPQALSESEVEQLITAAVAKTGASSMREMGAVMAILKPQMQGRADMSAVSALIKSKLSN